MSRIVLVQPTAGERLSGGYLYNARMAAHGAWETAGVEPERLGELLAEIEGDLVLADSLWLAPDSIAPLLALSARGLPLAFLLHSFPSLIAAAERGQPPPAAPSRFEIETLERVGRVVVPGPHYRDLLRPHRVAVTICPPGIDDAWRAPPRPRRDHCALISIGAVSARKGFLDVLDAMRCAGRQADLRWTLIGNLQVDPGYAQEVRALAAQCGEVSLLGQQQPDQVRKLLVASDLLVMPSHDENHPLVLLEAMAASVPAVAYDAGAAARMLGHGARGLVSPIGDRAALARNLTCLMDDEPRRYRMAQACWRWQRRLPSWASAAQHARRLLESWLDP
jgi:glycosyltransferase involved in cell wall biosynthesis